jgi:hypothetical protein
LFLIFSFLFPFRFTGLTLDSDKVACCNSVIRRLDQVIDEEEYDQDFLSRLSVSLIMDSSVLRIPYFVLRTLYSVLRIE